MTTNSNNTSAHLDGVCTKCFGWVGEPDTETDEMMSCIKCFGMARRAQPSEIVDEVRRLRSLLAATAQAYDDLVAQVWRAAGETHEPPADVAALLARVAAARREGAEAMRETCATRAREHAEALKAEATDALRRDHSAASRSYSMAAAAVGAVVDDLRALSLPGGAS